MTDWGEDVRRHYRSVVSDWIREYSDTYPGYPSSKKRTEILLTRLRESRARTLLDCGCGEGSPIRRVIERGTEAWGFDLVAEMVAAAREALQPIGREDRVWVGDITDRSSFRPAGRDLPETFDAVAAMGVFSHLDDGAVALQNMADAVRPGGRIFVEFRNELFSLFTNNRLTHHFILDKLMGSARKGRDPGRAKALERVAEDLRRCLRMDLPAVRPAPIGGPGYDEIPASFHNPFEIGKFFAPAGLRLTGVWFYHFHAFPPMYEREFPETFRAMSLEMEDPSDWRGHFMASAFVAEAVKGESTHP